MSKRKNRLAPDPFPALPLGGPVEIERPVDLAPAFASPRWRLQITEHVESLGLVVQAIDLDRGGAIRAASCAIEATNGDTVFTARGSAERSGAAIAQALDTLRWLVELA